MPLTVIVGPQVQDAGVVVGGPRAGRRGNSEHVLEVLPEFGEHEARVGGVHLDGLVERRGARCQAASATSTTPTTADASRLLQGEQVVGPAVWLLGGVPADDDGGGAVDVRRQVVDGVVGHWGGAKDSLCHCVARATFSEYTEPHPLLPGVWSWVS